MSTDGSFFSRWSQRKALVRHGAVVPAEPVVESADPAPPVAACLDELALARVQEPAAAEPAVAESTVAKSKVAENAPTESAVEPPPTLAEAQALTPASDFTRFVAPGVDNQVKNLALKRLFSDPHFNVMDGLDTYIDDYGKPDPIPPSMLRKMVQARALGLFTDDPEPQQTAEPGSEPLARNDATPEGLATNGATPEGLATSDATPEGLAHNVAMPERLAPKMNETHENADLRLQPHDAAGRPCPEPGAEPDTGRTG